MSVGTPMSAKITRRNFLSCITLQGVWSAPGQQLAGKVPDLYPLALRLCVTTVNKLFSAKSYVQGWPKPYIQKYGVFRYAVYLVLFLEIHDRIRICMTVCSFWPTIYGPYLQGIHSLQVSLNTVQRCNKKIISLQFRTQSAPLSIIIVILSAQISRAKQPLMWPQT